jgi:hypothetical protein
MMQYNNLFNATTFGNGVMGAWMGAFFFPIMAWSICWKGWALWKAAKADSKIWFVILLLVNTMGILDILYIFVLGKEKKGKVVLKKKSK